MIHIKAYTEDLDNNITFEYDVADRAAARLVAELKRENLTVEVESK